jgi:benzil reductase ((S)-benzoin forming)
MPTSTREQAAIVTGVSRGLGAALARELLEQGFAVLGVGRTSNEGLAGDRYRFAQIDLAEAPSTDGLLTSAFEDVADRRPGSVCLLNNAATVEPVGLIGQLAGADIATAIATNLSAAVVLANVFCRVFADPEVSRRIVNISSGAAERALPGEAVYCVSKAGMEMLTLALAAEQTAPTFRAITLRPGVIDTDMQAVIRSQPPEALPVVESFKGLHRGGRLVPPETVAAKIVSRLVLGDVATGRTYSYEDL